MTEISTPIYGLALALAEYGPRDRRRIIKIAKHIEHINRLASEQLTDEEEVDKTVKELEEEK